MAYASQAEMILAFGEREVIALTDRDNLGTLDAALLADQLDKASSEIDAYLVGRYSVPVSPVPPLIATFCCDIARYRLSGAAVAEVETVRNRYKDALRYLESIRDGKNNLPVELAPAPAAAQNLVQVVDGGDRIFSRSAR